MLLLVILPLPHVLSAHTPAGACLARLLLTLRSVCLPCLLLCHFFQPYCPVCVQVYKAKMGELDVAVKMIQKQHFVNCVIVERCSGYIQGQRVFMCNDSADNILLSTSTHNC